RRQASPSPGLASARRSVCAPGSRCFYCIAWEFVSRAGERALPAKSLFSFFWLMIRAEEKELTPMTSKSWSLFGKRSDKKRGSDRLRSPRWRLCLEKRVRPRLELLEDRTLLAVWTGADGSSWNDPLNWVGHKVPTDSATFDNTAQFSNCVVDASVSVGDLTL